MSSFNNYLELLDIIYEARLYVLVPLSLMLLMLSLFLLLRRSKLFFVCILALPLIVFPLEIAATYSGWKYRMLLVEQWGTMPDGSVNINIMPPHIREQYAQHNYRPRFRDVKTEILGALILIPIIIGDSAAAWWFCSSILQKA